MATLQVDARDLHSGGSQVAAAAHSAAQEFIGHETELAEAEAGWVGESREALAEFANTIAQHHAAAHTAATVLSQKMADAAVRYASTDGEASETVARIAGAMGL
jgi:hypothetical protein